MRILIFPRDPDLSNALARILEAEKYEVELSNNHSDGLQIVSDTHFDVVLVAQGEVNGDGTPIIETLRQMGFAAAAIIISTRYSSGDIVSSLNAGADDYLVYPICPSALIARIKAIYRRTSRNLAARLYHDGVELDLLNLELRVGGKAVETTTFEFRLLRYLVQHKRRIISARELETALYPTTGMRQSNSVQVYIGRLRQKLGSDRIRTIRGRGYLFV